MNQVDPFSLDALEARELLSKNGIPFLSVTPYECSDNCGPGPRFIVRGLASSTVRKNRQGRIYPLCFNLSELKDFVRKHYKKYYLTKKHPSG